ncbi:unnamed protein product [Meloidogyne enterolobii]|uniref:Uncharacterized protein n=1 Tax=Meloidogyne enterolobii TaxID=390850 RepID=A0ACB0XPQ6_MELEN
MKAMGFEHPQQSQQHSQKNKNPEIGVSITSNNSSINCNSSTKKQLKKEKATNNNKLWTSSRLEEKKRLWKKELEEPLLKRIPKNLLTSLGWKNPITIISPFTNRNNNNNNNQQQQAIDKKEAIKIWNQNPAPEQFLEKTIIEQQI